MKHFLDHTGAEDPRCPLAGLDAPVSRASKAYEEANCPDNFKVWTYHIEKRIR